MKLTLLVLSTLVGLLGDASKDPCNGMTLTDVARSAGLAFTHINGATGAKHLPETMGSGIAWLDFDSDGWIDLYVVQSGSFPPDGAAASANRLYRNRGDGTFEDVTQRSGVGDRGYGQGVVAGDVNGDGHTDLFVCNFGRDALYLNRGDGTFENATARAGVALEGWSSSAAFADADGDGDLDLYVARYLEYDPGAALYCGLPDTDERRYCDPSLFRGASNRFYRNRGDGTFEDATAAAGLQDPGGKSLGVLFTDLDGDGWPELYVANDLTFNNLYRNRGNGTFEDVSLLSGTAVNREGKVEAGMGLAVGDLDGDGDPDLVKSNFDVELNTFYQNLGALMFEDVSARSGFGPPSFNLLGFGIVLADLDRDGDLDAYVANGHILDKPLRESVTHAQRGLLLLGDGKGHFREQRCGPAFERAEVGRGLAVADYDNDGDPDLAILNNGGPLQLLRNDGAGGQWLGLRLRGRAPNTGAVGARVNLTTDTGRQVRWRLAGDSYQSSSDPRVLFGLPRSDRVRTLEIVWPHGTPTVLEKVALGAYTTVAQDDPATQTQTVPSARQLRESDK